MIAIVSRSHAAQNLEALTVSFAIAQDAGSRSMPPMQARAISIICDGV
jgi:hypothetical protein